MRSQVGGEARSVVVMDRRTITGASYSYKYSIDHEGSPATFMAQPWKSSDLVSGNLVRKQKVI